MLGPCIKNVKIVYIIQLLRLADRKVDIVFDDGILKSLMENDKAFLQAIKEPYNINDPDFQSDEHLIIDMVKMSYTQFVKAMLELDANMSVTSRRAITLPNGQEIKVGTSLFQIAYEIKNKNILAMIMASTHSDDVGIYETLKKEDIFYKEVKQTAMVDQKLAQPLILLDPEMLVPQDLLNSFNYSMRQYIMKYPA